MLRRNDLSTVKSVLAIPGRLILSVSWYGSSGASLAPRASDLGRLRRVALDHNLVTNRDIFSVLLLKSTKTTGIQLAAMLIFISAALVICLGECFLCVQGKEDRFVERYKA